MQLGASGILNLMNSMGGLKAASSFWNAGDKVAYIFYVDPEVGNASDGIPFAFRYGHNIDMGDAYSRSFLPTTSEIDETSKLPKEPDFVYKTAGLMRALLKGEDEQKRAKIQRDYPNEVTRKIELENHEKAMKNRFPAVGPLMVKAYTEVAVCRLDVNGRVVNNDVKFDYGSLSISKKKLNQLIQVAQTEGAYIPGTNYFYVVMQTLPGDKKLSGQVDWNAVTEPEKRLETLHPDFQEKITQLMNDRKPTEESIAAKIYDFRPYDLAEFKTAVANYVAPREYMLKDLDNNFFDFVRREQNVELLRTLNLVASAEQIQKLIDAENATTNATPNVVGGDTAQAVDVEKLLAESGANEDVPFTMENQVPQQ